MMNRPLFKRILPQALAWTALAVLSGVGSLAQDNSSTKAAYPAPAQPSAAVPSPEPSPAQATADQATTPRTDGQIETDVVHALDTSKALKNDLITAATIQGEVTLSGTVSSEASSELAEAIVNHVQGVTKVNNNLMVGDPTASPKPDAQATADNPPDDAGVPDPNETPAQAQMRAQIRDQVRAEIQAQRQAQQAAKGPVTLPEGTLLQLRTIQPVSTKRAKDGTPVDFVVIQDVTYGGVLAIPRGAAVHGVVSQVKKAGDLKGEPELALKLTSLDLGGQNYLVASDQFMVKGPGKGGQTAGNVVGGTLIGTMIGCAVSRWGCLVGAGAGAAAGTAASAATPGPNVWIPSEARVDFRLDQPLTVTPVSPQEAARLAQGLYPGGPTLYRRAYYDPYAYPPVYFRPYYMVGGYYYWR
ncbi:MAG: BON domain-containing protein [Terracidiphilus sp.]